MKLKNLMLLTISLGLFMGSILDAGHHKSCKKPCIPCDPIVGLFTTKLTSDYGTMLFHADGTWSGQVASDLLVPIEGFDPCGNLATVSTGTWEKIATQTYKLFVTSVLVENAGEGSSCCCPTSPLARTKVEAIIRLSEDASSFTAPNAMFSLWDVDDLTLNTTNILPPVPIGPIHGVRVGDSYCSCDQSIR